MSDPKEPGKDPSEMSFEEAMRELEALVGQLEHGDVPLEQSIALDERGAAPRSYSAALKARCETKLTEAEEKVAKLTLGADGAPKGTEPLDAG